MKLEITVDQYNQIQDEIIKLEDEMRDTRDKMNGWDRQYFSDIIALMKDICNKGYITIGL